MRIFSYGGGVQSTAALVLAAQGKIDFPTFIFANVGDDSENPATIRYVREIAMPYATTSIQLIEIARPGRTLYERTITDERSIKIPVRMANGAPGNRNCTETYKRAVIRRWLGKGNHVVGLGISMDEIERMRTDSGYKSIINEYPLIDMGMNRQDCIRVIESVGLPVPPKSSCWFCPFHTRHAWRDMKRNEPELFQKAVELEALLNQKRESLGKDHIFLHSSARPLDRAVGDQLSLFDEPNDICAGSSCMT